MPIFRYILTLLFPIFLFGQSKLIILDNSDSLRVDSAKSILDELTTKLYNWDDLGNYFLLDKINSDSIIHYNTIRQEIYLDTLIYKNNAINERVSKQISKTLLGIKPFINTNNQFRRIVNINSFITDSSTIEYGLINSKKVGAVLNLKTNFNNYFSGLFGASNNNNKWIINGQIDLHLENQWRSANLIDLHWKRLNSDSQLLNLLIEEPHPFGLPIGVSVTYRQDLRDGNFVNNESTVGIIKTVPGIAKIGFGGKSAKISSTAKGDSLGIGELESRSIYLSGQIDHRNNYWLANSGYLLRLFADVGERTENDASTVSMGISSEFGKYFELSQKSNIFIKLSGQGKRVGKGETHDGELIRYGGVNNLRGNVEDAFKSEWVIISNIEYNFDFSQSQRFTLFADLAFQTKYSPLPYGVGTGLIQVTKNSVFKLFYGIGRGDKLSNGKIHIQFLTKI